MSGSGATGSLPAAGDLAAARVLAARILAGTSDETPGQSSACLVCERPVTGSATGRPRRYCSRSCQQRAYRARSTTSPALQADRDRAAAI